MLCFLSVAKKKKKEKIQRGKKLGNEKGLDFARQERGHSIAVEGGGVRREAGAAGEWVLRNEFSRWAGTSSSNGIGKPTD